MENSSSYYYTTHHLSNLARPVICNLKSRPPLPGRKPGPKAPEKARAAPEWVRCEKIVLQPRMCTLRSFGSSDPPAGGVAMRTTNAVGSTLAGDGGGGEVSPFFARLSDYIESSKKSHDFEIISGRLAMIVFAATVTREWSTGNSLFQKTDLQGIIEAGVACVGAVTCAAIFAWFSRTRSRASRIFTLSCNAFIDSLIDQIIDGLFYEIELSDWTDEI